MLRGKQPISGALEPWQDRSALTAVFGQQLALGGCCKTAGQEMIPLLLWVCTVVSACDC